MFNNVSITSLAKDKSFPVFWKISRITLIKIADSTWTKLNVLAAVRLIIFLFLNKSNLRILYFLISR